MNEWFSLYDPEMGPLFMDRHLSIRQKKSKPLYENFYYLYIKIKQCIPKTKLNFFISSFLIKIQ
jgi:hypothetical protein